MSESAFVAAVDAQARAHPEHVAFRNSAGEELTYAELRAWSDALAGRLASDPALPAGVPLMVYGHKSPLMLACFFAAVKSGHAYVPVDAVYPPERVANIAGQLGATALLDTMGAYAQAPAGEAGAAGAVGPSRRAELPCPVIGPSALRAACAGACGTDAEARSHPDDLPGLAADDTFYILFTSGSTGTPKGVEVTAGCVDGFYRWTSRFFGLDDARDHIWFNRAAFSFDLSVTDLVCGLGHGATLFALEAQAEKSLSATFSALARSGVTDWVSTPSFVDQCLADDAFDAGLLPCLRRVITCGETLRPATVRQMRERFGQVHFFNAYGPTEATDFVTCCEITDDLLAGDRALPVGFAKTGTELFVLDPATLAPVPAGKPGELFIVGDTVAKGYWARPEQTQAAFGSCPPTLAHGRRAYRTGDEATLDERGMLWFHGRLDLQVKLHGFRIELGDVEASLCALPQVRAACVLPVERDGQVVHLTAFIVAADAEGPRGFALTRELKRGLREALPAYMIPSSFKYLDEMPLTPNGKADRKALGQLLAPQDPRGAQGSQGSQG